MAANEIRVNTNRLGTDADRVNALIKNMEKAINEMKNSVSQMNQMWEGEAKNAFVTAFNDDMNAAADVIEELKSLQTFEAQAKTEYEKSERQIMELVNSIRV